MSHCLTELGLKALTETGLNHVNLAFIGFQAVEPVGKPMIAMIGVRITSRTQHAPLLTSSQLDQTTLLEYSAGPD